MIRSRNIVADLFFLQLRMRPLLHVSRPRTVSSRTPTTCVTPSPTPLPPTSSLPRTRRPSRPTLTRPSSGSTTRRRPRRRSTRRSRRSSRVLPTPLSRSCTPVLVVLPEASLEVLPPEASPVVLLAVPQRRALRSRRSTKRIIPSSMFSLVSRTFCDIVYCCACLRFRCWT